jgi:SsrA-binding protein
VKVLAANRRARFEYEFLERLTSGIALTGSEVKSVRAGHVKLQDGWVAFEAGEAFLADVHIAPYENAGYANHDPIRRRKLLMHSRDIARFAAKVIEKGLTVIPIAVGLEGNWIKVELALAKGKTLYDKRETLRRRTMDREAEAAMKEHR